MRFVPSSRLFLGLIPWYSLCIVVGILLAFFLAQKEEKRKHLPKDTMLDLALIIVPFGLVCARLYYVAFQLPYYLHHPLEIFAIWHGGLAIYGGILGGFFSAFLWCKYKNINLLKVADAIAPGLILAQAIGRWGNFFNMEAYGAVVSNPALQFFPFAVYIPQKAMFFQATFFYESLWNLLSFLFLWRTRQRIKCHGDTFFAYLLLYGIGRTFIEGLRSDSLYFWGFRVSQVLSVLLVLLVLAYFAYRYFHNFTKPLILTAFIFLAFVALLHHTPWPLFWLLLVFCFVYMPTKKWLYALWGIALQGALLFSSFATLALFLLFLLYLSFLLYQGDNPCVTSP